MLTVTLAAATLTGMTALPVFATNTIVNKWVGSDAVEADQEHGIAANPGTAITTKQTITVTNVDDKSESLQVTAYQLVKGTYKDGKLTGYVLCDPDKASIADLAHPTATEITAIASAINATGNDQTTLQGIQMTRGTTDNTKSQFTADVEAGLYIVLVSGSDTVIYNPAVVAVNVTDANQIALTASGGTVDMKKYFIYPANAYMKSSQSSLEKEIVSTNAENPAENPHAESAAYGDKVSFKIGKMTIPSYSAEYKEVQYKIEDTLDPDGFAGIKDLTVKVGTDADNLAEVSPSVDDDNDPDTPDAINYTLVYKDKKGDPITNTEKIPTDAVTFVISFDNDYIMKNPTKKVEITYSSKIREGAQVNFYEHKNTATLSYSNDPNDKTKVKTQKSDTYHYTFGIDADINYEASNNFTTYELNKVTEANQTYTDGVSEKPLKDAVFTLYSDEAMTNGIRTAISDNKGHISFKGLDAATYYLKETAAPSGYTINENDYKITIAAGLLDDGSMNWYSIKTELKTENGYTQIGFAKYTCTNPSIGNDGSITYTAIQQNNGIEDVTNAIDPAEIVNTTLVELPSTGGMGTIIITVLSAIGMGGFLIIFIVSIRKKNRKED